MTALHCSILELFYLLNLNFDADPDPYTVITLNADPDSEISQNNTDLHLVRKPDHNHTS